MISYSDTLSNYVKRVRRYLAEPKPERSRWTDDFLKQLFNSAYRRRVAQLIMAAEGAFENEVKITALTSSTVFTHILETFDQLSTFTALNAQSTISSDSTIKQQGLYSLNLNKSAGNATVGFTKTYPANFSVTFAYSDLLKLRVYPTNSLSAVTSTGIVVKLGHDASNYYQWTFDPSTLTAAAWNTLSIDITTPSSSVGTPSLGALSYFEFNLVFGAAGDTYTGFKVDYLTVQEKPTNISYYPWPPGFERMIRMELETTDSRRIPLSRDQRAVRSVSMNSSGFVGNMSTYRPVSGGFVLEPPLNDSASIANIIIGYVGTPPLLVGDNDKLSSDFPVSFDELLVLDTAMAAMDDESMLEGGQLKSIVRLRAEYDEDWLRYIDNRITSLRRIEMAETYYEDY